MNIILDGINIILLVTAILNTALAAIIYFSSGKKEYAKIYSTHILAIISWILIMVLYRSSTTQAVAMSFTMALYIAPTFIASIFFLFTCIFPYRDKANLKTQLAIVFIWNAVIVAITAVPGLVIKNLVVIPGGEKAILFGKGYVLYFAYIIIVFSVSYLKLFWKYFKTEKRAKAQTLYILVGHFLSSNVAFAANLILPWIGFFKFNWAGQAFTFIMLAMTTYAIIAHRLMDIKLVMKRWSVRTFSIFFIVVLVVSIKVGMISLWGELSAWGDFIIVILVTILYPYVNRFSSYIAHRYFFYSLYDMDEVVLDMNKKLASSIDQEEVYDFLYKTFTNIFHFRNFIIMTKESPREYIVSYVKGFKIAKNSRAVADRLLENECAIKNGILDEDDFKEHDLTIVSKGKENNILKRQVEILLPLNTKNGLIGIMLFGPKESGDMYSESDFKLLYIIGSQLASSMENIDLYAKIKSLNKNLEKKVLKQTKEIKDKAEKLKTQNENLEKLLQIKNEFLRVVNHQINTPISIIKNSVFMIRSKSFTLDKGLSFIEEGTRRMEGVMSDFWRAFSVEGEGVKMNYSKTDLFTITKDIAGSLSSLSAIKSGNVKLSLSKSEKLPKVKTDPTQISQVLNNLIDNAISYTTKGTVKIDMRKEGDGVKVYISDTGQGIEKSNYKRLFEKFYRTERAKKFKPGGSGLGLYIAKKIVEAGGGRMKLEKSEIGKGSTFSFTVPIWK